MRALVTGATGFVGASFVRELLRLGHEVHVLIRPRTELPLHLKDAKIHIYRGHAQDVQSAVSGARPDKVFHFASLFLAEHSFEQIDALIDANLKFSTQLVDAMISNKCLTLISAGTSWQNFEGQKGCPTNLYAATKEAFECILRYYASAYGLKACVLKLFDTYGPFDRRKKLLSILRDAGHSGKPLAMSAGEQKLDFLHISDVLSAFLIAGEWADKCAPGVEEFYLRSGELLSLRELVELFSRQLGKPIPIEWGKRPYRAREVMLPWREGATLPGWTPKVRLEVGLREFANEVQS